MFHHDNLILRKLERKHLGRLQDLKNESWFGTHQVSIVNSEDQENWFDSLNSAVNCPKNLVLIAEIFTEISSYEFGIVKLLHIDWYNRRAEMGWDVFEDCRSKGYGKKLVQAGVAFAKDVLQLHRLRAEILDTNVASQKCAEHAGFIKEGTEREAILKKGSYVDSHIYGILF